MNANRCHLTLDDLSRWHARIYRRLAQHEGKPSYWLAWHAAIPEIVRWHRAVKDLLVRRKRQEEKNP